MSLHFLCVLLTLATVIAPGFRYEFKDDGKDDEWTKLAEKTMHILKMTDVSPVLDQLRRAEAIEDQKCTTIEQKNLRNQNQPGSVEMPYPKSPYIGLYAFNTAVKFNEQKTKVTTQKNGKKYDSDALEFAHFDAFKVEGGKWKYFGFVCFKIEYKKSKKKKKKNNGLVPVILGTVDVQPGTDAPNGIHEESVIDGEMVKDAFDYRMNDGAPGQLGTAIEFGEYQVLVLIDVGFRLRKKFEEPILIQFRTSGVQWMSKRLNPFDSHVYTIRKVQVKKKKKEKKDKAQVKKTQTQKKDKAHMAPYNRGFEQFSAHAEQKYYEQEYGNDYSLSKKAYSAPIVVSNDYDYTPFWVSMVFNMFTTFIIMVCMVCMAVFVCLVLVYERYNTLAEQQNKYDQLNMQNQQV